MVVPATFEDYRCYVANFYEHIEEGYILPDEIIIVVSGVPKGYHESRLPLSQQLEARVETMFESRPHNQARNKNTGATMASGDLILFFDIDDSMHPWGVYAVKEAYKVNSQAAILSGVMFSHDFFQDKVKQAYARTGQIPTCTIPGEDGVLCKRLASFKRRHGLVTPFDPHCRTTLQPCKSQLAYFSSKLYQDCFAEHVAEYPVTRVNWCCLSEERPKFAAGWLLVKRTDFLNFLPNYDVAEDGQLIAHYLADEKQIIYVDIPIAFYNMNHDNPRCSGTWF